MTKLQYSNQPSPQNEVTYCKSKTNERHHKIKLNVKISMKQLTQI